jgi:spermidine export protein MdtJ
MVPMRLSWLFLIAAILTEVAGLTAMKAMTANADAAGSYSGYAGYLIMYGAIALSYFFLAKAVEKISVGVAYAVWEGSGVALITLVSVAIFGHHLTGRELLGLALAVAGILCVNAGETHDGETDDRDMVEEGQ